jgi:SagB-type dehydrogenase family enzyme
MPMENLRKHLKNPSLEVLQAAGESDQRRGVAPPPLEKPAPRGARRIPLTPGEALTLGSMPVAEAIGRRKSRRAFAQDALSLDELSYLLWATQGIREIHPKRTHAFRTVPSGGCRHPFETYLVVRRVEGVTPGLWRYSALDHALVHVWDEPPAGPSKLSEVCYGQSWIDGAAVAFVWTAIPYRTEWRYGPDSLKDILLSCGHICQNLYLACESIGAGTCAVVAYDQSALDPFLGVDGVEEIALYVAPVGKPAQV